METPAERFTVDQTPNPGDIDRTLATERANKMPPIAGAAMDPKKVIGLAAAAGAVMFTVLALGSGITGNSRWLGNRSAVNWPLSVTSDGWIAVEPCTA